MMNIPLGLTAGMAALLAQSGGYITGGPDASVMSDMEEARKRAALAASERLMQQEWNFEGTRKTLSNKERSNRKAKKKQSKQSRKRNRK